jgi:hypothetical protein
MTITKCLWKNKLLLRQSRVFTVAGMGLMMAAAASGQFTRVPGTAQSGMVPCPVAGYTCYPQSIAVGPNANGSTLGTAWVLGTAKTSEGDYYVYQRQGSSWVRTDGAGLQIAVGLGGYPWVITHLGTIYYWNGSTFVLAPGDGCATSIGVGPGYLFQYGDAWIIGCDGSSTTDGTLYRFEGSGWVYQIGQVANRIAVAPDDEPFLINLSGQVLVWIDGVATEQAPGCATSIAAGYLSGTQYPDLWITGCGNVNNQGAKIFQLQNNKWVRIPGVASQAAVSPDLGVAWVVTLTGEIFAYE